MKILVKTYILLVCLFSIFLIQSCKKDEITAHLYPANSKVIFNPTKINVEKDLGVVKYPLTIDGISTFATKNSDYYYYLHDSNGRVFQNIPDYWLIDY